MRYIYRPDPHVANLCDVICIQRADLFAVMYGLPKTKTGFFAGIDVPKGILFRQNLQAFHMITVLMSHENPREISDRSVPILQCGMNFLRADARVYEYCRLSAFYEIAVTTASARKRAKAQIHSNSSYPEVSSSWHYLYTFYVIIL